MTGAQRLRRQAGIASTGGTITLFAAKAKLTLAARATFRAEYKTGTASVLAWVGDARILALRLDKFDNSYFALNYNVQATTSAGYQEFLTLTQTPQAVDHPVSTTVSGYAQALQGATSLSEVVKESQNTAGYQYLGMVRKQAATSTHGSGKPGPRPRTSRHHRRHSQISPSNSSLSMRAWVAHLGVGKKSGPLRSANRLIVGLKLPLML